MFKAILLMIFLLLVFWGSVKLRSRTKEEKRSAKQQSHHKQLDSTIYVTAEDLVKRVKKEGLWQNYSIVINVIIGLVITNSIPILSEIVSIRQFDLLPYWISSSVATVLIYRSTTVGISIAGWIPNLIDVLGPVVLGMVLYAMFFVLPFSIENPGDIKLWYLLLCIFGLTAAILVHNAIRNIDDARNYEGVIRAGVLKYKDRLQGDCLSAFLTGVVGGAVFTVMFSCPTLQPYSWICQYLVCNSFCKYVNNWHWIIATLVFFPFVIALLNQQKHIKVILEFLD